MFLKCFFPALSEGRLANAQARVLCHVRFWAELEPLGDCEANSKDPCQTGEQEARLGTYAREDRKVNIDQHNCPCKAHSYRLPCVQMGVVQNMSR